MSEAESARLMAAYVRSFFVPLEVLARRVGAEPASVQQLISAGAAPGIVYAQYADGAWWSALAAFTGKQDRQPPQDAVGWYAPAASYWLRRALLGQRGGLTAEAAAEANRDAFADQFVVALRAEPLASGNFTSAFGSDGEVDLTRVRQVADAEWQGWVSGAYGVCLRAFTGETCVQKEALARRIRAYFDRDEGADLTDIELLDHSNRLAALLLPFAPDERAVGTPGKAVDAVLAQLRLGHDDPYSRLVW